MKRIMIKFTFQCDPVKFEKFCKEAMIGNNEAHHYLRDIAIKTSTNKINEVLDET